MLKEKLKMMNGVLENGNYQLGQFAFVKRSETMKSPVGTLSDRTVLPQARWKGLALTSSRLWSEAEQ